MNKWMKTERMIVALCAVLSATATASAEPSKRAPAATKTADGAGEKATGKASKGADKPHEKRADRAARSAQKGNASNEVALDKVVGESEDTDVKTDAKEEKHPPKKVAHKAKSKDDKAASRAKTAPASKDQPTPKASKDETRRHARRLAQLEHAKEVASDAKNATKLERVTKLIAKENARHDKWVARHDAKSADKAPSK